MKTDVIKPYRIGERVKVYLSESPGVSLFTTGIIVTTGDKPKIAYKDLSALELNHFDRFVKSTEVIMPISFKTHKKR